VTAQSREQCKNTAEGHLSLDAFSAWQKKGSTNDRVQLERGALAGGESSGVEEGVERKRQAGLDAANEHGLTPGGEGEGERGGGDFQGGPCGIGKRCFVAILVFSCHGLGRFRMFFQRASQSCTGQNSRPNDGGRSGTPADLGRSSSPVCLCVCSSPLRSPMSRAAEGWRIQRALAGCTSQGGRR